MTVASRTRDVPTTSESVALLSSAERRTLSLDRSGSRSACVWTSAVRLRGTLDHDALVRAGRRLTDRHEMLRTRFPDGGPGRVVEPPWVADGIAWRRVDRSALDASAIDESLRELADAELTTGGVDPAREILRGLIVALPTGTDGTPQHAVLLTAHTVGLDDWSAGLLWRDLGALYRSEVTGDAPDLPDPATGSAEHARRQCEHLGSEGSRLLDEACARLGRLPRTRLPEPTTDAERRRPLHRHVGRVPVSEVTALRGSTRSRGASDVVLLCAAFAEALGRALGTDDVAFGTSSAGRDGGTVDTLGYFVDRLVLRVRPAGPGELGETARRVGTALYTEMLSGLPFEYLLEHRFPEQYRDPSPLVDVLFVIGGRAPDPDFGPLEARAETVSDTPPRAGLLVFLRETGDGWAIHLTHGPNTSAAAVDDVVGRFRRIVAGENPMRHADAPEPQEARR